MKTIILHIGAPKTGTTSIQVTLFSNRELLLQHGILYPSFSRGHKVFDYPLFDCCESVVEDVATSWKEMILTKDSSIFNESASTIETLRTELAIYHDEISRTDASTVIISSEAISLLKVDDASRLKNWFSQFGRVVVVYYARELSSFISSISQQLGKGGWTNRSLAYERAIMRLLDPIPLWRDVVGKENFHVIKFEDAIREGVTDSLLRVAGLPSLTQMGIKEERRNDGISADAVECFYQLNHVAPRGTAHRNKRLCRFLRKVPGGKYKAPALSNAEVEDYNKKVAALETLLATELYPKLSYQGDSDNREPFSIETIRFLMREMNDTYNEVDQLKAQVRELKRKQRSIARRVLSKLKRLAKTFLDRLTRTAGKHL